MSFQVVPTFESLDEILNCDLSSGSYIISSCTFLQYCLIAITLQNIILDSFSFLNLDSFQNASAEGAFMSVYFIPGIS